MSYEAILLPEGGTALRSLAPRAEDPNGFYGVDGLVQFGPDGTPNRGLAIYQIRNGRFVIIDEAPKTVVGPS